MIIDNLKKYTSNTGNICNYKNKGSECALNKNDVINLTARFCNRRTDIKLFKEAAPHTSIQYIMYG